LGFREEEASPSLKPLWWVPAESLENTSHTATILSSIRNKSQGRFLSSHTCGKQHSCFADNFRAWSTHGEGGRPLGSGLGRGNVNLVVTLREPVWRNAGVMDFKERKDKQDSDSLAHWL